MNPRGGTESDRNVAADRGTASNAAQRLQGKTALVLGAGAKDNMGQAIARRFAAEGARVVVAGRRRGELEDLAEEISGGAIECDITDVASVDLLFQSVGSELHIAVNTVGRNLMRPFMETTARDLDELCKAHMLGPLLFTQAAVRSMPGGGSIIQISSVSAKMLILDHVAYMMTKAAGEILVRAAAYEFGARGIRVNSIAPALTATPMTSAFFADDKLVSTITGSIPLRRLGTIEDVAGAAVWLASDECFMTGETLQINGGVALHASFSV